MQRHGNRMEDADNKRAGRVRPGVLMLLAAFGAATAVASLLLLQWTLWGHGPAQPIPFSHRLHAGVKGINCRFCHPFVERSARAGIPEVGKCLYCHNYIIKQHPEILKEHRYYDTGEPAPWVRLFLTADHVHFRHQPHILRGFECTQCHGAVHTLDRLPRHQFRMGFCIDCHRTNQGNLACWLGCHN